MRRLLAPLLGLMTLPVIALASTEPSPVSIGLEVHGGQTVVALQNRSSEPLQVHLELRPRGGRLDLVPEEDQSLAPGELRELPLEWSEVPEGGSLQARVWIQGSSAFEQARLFQLGRGLIPFAEYLASAAPIRLETQPQLLRSESREVTGQVSFPTFTGGVEPLRRAYVQAAGQRTLSDDQGRFRLVGLPAGETTLEVVLESTHWKIHHPGQSEPYRFSTSAFEVPEQGEVDLGEILLPAGQPVTEGAWIHHVAVRAERFLQGHGDDLTWWSQLPIAWPDSGDYYSWGSLHISEAHRWDVVGHELGHAIYFGAGSFSSGGGSHKIDECYSPGLALSEGWATYFSAAIHLERDDPDAKFEFLVPRRAPIRIENVPEDVCAGSTNEWRVAAFFWDLFDTHPDLQEDLALDWGPAGWQVLRSGFRAKSVIEATTKLREALEPEVASQVDQVASQNQVSE